jgi:nicotinate-nucleotide pyrophosphorylase (carboxylating)
LHRTDDQSLPNVGKLLPADLNHPGVFDLFEISLREDLFSTPSDQWTTNDITSVATINPETQISGVISAKSQGIVAGLPVAEVIFSMVDPKIEFKAEKVEGQPVGPGDLLARVMGSGPSLLVGERVALNFLGRMSGVATLTQAYVDAVSGTEAVILDTRKTIPGWRYLDKYAVRMGGGQNHRMGLYDMVLIKDNHIDGAGGITNAVQRVRKMHGSQYPIEVEVKTFAELDETIGLAPERIMLDNMSLTMMSKAVAITAGQIPLEASGNVSLDTVREIAETGVDYISVGALTHSAPVFDVSMRMA